MKQWGTVASAIIKLACRKNKGRQKKWAAMIKTSALKAAKARRVGKFHDALLKLAQLPQYSPVPFSSLTSRSDFAANRKFAPEPPNEYTSSEQALIELLKRGMSRSRARIVDAHKRGRLTPNK